MHPELSTSASRGILSPFPLSSSHSLSPVISLLVIHPPSLSHPLYSSLPPYILALTHYELLAALMYSQYSFYHISTAAVCKERDRKRRRGGKGIKREREREREREDGEETHLFYSSQR